ncbi:MAG: class I SAM-dependent methyltransferase [Opitutaceae bacterium]|jgi:23S rRNA (cytosine1962-C5)-methyltransferase|nr:class I SAM-dependent methyltransferase [Opitutaceae bacterium]
MPARIDIQRSTLVTADGWRDYRLLDCGDGMKMERWGAHTLVRPDPQIIWPRAGSTAKPWNDWDGFYHRSEKGGGHWEFRKPLPEHWTIRYQPLDLTLRIRPTNFKHTGLFPEQAANWEWLSEKIRAAKNGKRNGGNQEENRGGGREGSDGREVSVLNLFGYTGAATCAAAKAGANVCHVDAAEGMVKWCRENIALSGLGSAPVRYIVDDCLKFVRRENKRGRRYDAVIMDPPTYGRGSGGEMWKLEDNLQELLAECRALLTERPVFFLVNAYTARLSPTALVNLLAWLMRERGGTITGGEVGLPIDAEAGADADADGKILPCGIYGRWEAP